MQNLVMLQAFEWQTLADGTHYRRLKAWAPKLRDLGVGAVWLPPAAKGVSDMDVGYSSYDLWDLGEFQQKGTVRTKYGTKKELEELIEALHQEGIQVLADMVLNHKGGADFSERFMAVKVNPDDRLEEISEPHEIEGWTGFDFPGRKDRYSAFKWNFEHFTGVDYDQATGDSGIFRILGENKFWSKETDTEKGNFDYLMNADIDHDHPAVRDELFKLCFWMIDEMGYDGFRYDALKHISRSFIHELSTAIDQKHPNFYFVGEYWQGASSILDAYLENTDYRIDMFDVPLHFRLHEASHDGDFDLRTLLDDTLVRDHPLQTVTFVDNHDSQPGQSLESFVDPLFKEFAYAFILLRKDGYPCVFWADLVGIEGGPYAGIQERLEGLLRLRRDVAYGDEEAIDLEPQLVGWLRHGDAEHPTKLLVLFSRKEDRSVQYSFGEGFEGKRWVPALSEGEAVVLDDSGAGEFHLKAGVPAYWTLRD